MKASVDGASKGTTSTLAPTPRTATTPPGERATTITATVAIPFEGLVVETAPPAFVCQYNVEAVVGVPAAAYLGLLRQPDCPLSVIRVKRLRLVDRGELVSWLKSRARRRAVTPIDREPTPDDVLRELNLERLPLRKVG